MRRLEKNSKNKKKRTLAMDDTMMDNEEKVEIWKDSGVFVDAMEFSDMRLALGNKLVGSFAKRESQVIPPKFYDAFYTAERVQGGHITDLCYREKAEGKKHEIKGKVEDERKDGKKNGKRKDNILRKDIGTIYENDGSDEENDNNKEGMNMDFIDEDFLHEDGDFKSSSGGEKDEKRIGKEERTDRENEEKYSDTEKRKETERGKKIERKK